MTAQDLTTAAPFPVTQWSLVARAGGSAGGGAPAARDALDCLLRRCLPALRAHLRLDRRFGAHEAEDLLQGFVAERVLERGLVAAADQRKWRFRTFLLRALDCYCADRRRHHSALKRAPGGETVTSLDEAGGAEARVRTYGQSGGGGGGTPPADAFDRAWGRQLLDEAVERMRRECDAPDSPDKRVVWEVFQGRVLAPALDGAEPLAYERLVERFDLRSPTQAANILITGKRMFVRVLRSVVAQYADDESEIDGEIRELHEVFSRGGGGSGGG